MGKGDDFIEKGGKEETLAASHAGAVGVGVRSLAAGKVGNIGQGFG